MKRIKDWDPNGHVVLACRPGLGDFFLRSGLADEVVVINKRNKAQMSEAMKTLRSRNWDIIFSPHESFRTASLLFSLKARHKVSFRRWWNRFFYDTRVQKPMALPDALRQQSLLTPFDERLAELFAQEDLQDLRNRSDKEEFTDFRSPLIPEWASMKIMELQPGETPVVFMAPGSTWNTKRWTARGFVDLAKLLHSEGFKIGLVGSKDERPLCEEISKKLSESLIEVRNYAGETSLVELAYLLRTGRALITNDSGAMHAAAVSGLPTVAIFGPTTLSLGFRPWNNQAVVVQKDLACRPCGKHGHKACPLGHHDCMEKIEARQVMKACRELLGIFGSC